MPADVKSVQASLHRLHKALKSVNTTAPGEARCAISLRILKPGDYGRLRNETDLECPLHSRLYPMQVHILEGKRISDESKLLLAGTTMTSSSQSAGLGLPGLDFLLTTKLQPIQRRPEENLKKIASVRTPNSEDMHYLYQDVSAAWSKQASLLDLMEAKGKYEKYMELAVSIALTFSYIAAVGLFDAYPSLSDFINFAQKKSQQLRQQPQKHKVDEWGIVNPFVDAKFGIAGPPRSTAALGGSFGTLLAEDDAMIHLGVLLHQIGRWSVIKAPNIGKAREEAMSKRSDLLLDTGIPYTNVVDLCLNAEYNSGEGVSAADKIYKKVVVPLEEHAGQLNQNLGYLGSA